MSTIEIPASNAKSAAPRLRTVYREADGQVHLDWPQARVDEAIQQPDGTTWIDIDDRNSDLPGVEALFRDTFHFHPLAIEDALRDSNVPKLDDWGEYLYIVFHSIDFNPDTDDLELHELDVFLGRNYLVTYHTEPLALLDRLRQAIERDGGQRLAHGPDHLLYVLLDLGVTDYLPAIEHLDDAIDTAQDEVFEAPNTRTVQKIFRIKRSALRLHRALIPLREVVNRLARDEHPQIDAQDRVYFRDIYDHLMRVHDISETLRDLISGALDTYLSAISNRTNEVMKTLTIVTVMFLPMSFLASFFGMNFFGETLAFKTELPRAFMFWSACLIMVLTAGWMWFWAHGRKIPWRRASRYKHREKKRTGESHPHQW
jgi:magnesium transporter